MIIGLYGDSRSGKDTIAKEIVEYTEGRYEWRSFAVVLRELLLAIDPWMPDPFGYAVRYSDELNAHGLDGMKKLFPESVDLMIRLGQGARDILGEDVWVDPILTDLTGDEDMIISDCRQPNEYESIINLGGEVWKVVRPGTTRRGMDGLLDHLTFPVTLHNNRGTNDLKLQVRREIDALQDRRS